MSLIDWLLGDHKKPFEPEENLSGEEVAASFFKTLTNRAIPFDDQIPIIFDAANSYPDIAFCQQCMDHIQKILNYQKQRNKLQHEYNAKCVSGGFRKSVRTPAVDTVHLRFAAQWKPVDDFIPAIEDMLGEMAKSGYIESSREAITDLRQGFGYYRKDEDTCRPRSPVRWLRAQNALHYWMCLLLDKKHNPYPIIGVPPGNPGCWVTTAAIFSDRNGNAFTYDRLEHGRLTDTEQIKFLTRNVPRRMLAK